MKQTVRQNRYQVKVTLSINAFDEKEAEEKIRAVIQDATGFYNGVFITISLNGQPFEITKLPF